VAAGLGIMIGMIYKIGIGEVWNTVRGLNPYYFLAAFILKLLSLVIKLLRWELLFPSVMRRASWQLYIIVLAANQVAPTGTGELASTYLARGSYGIHPGRTLGALVIGRMLDTTFLVGMSILALILVIHAEVYYFSMVLPVLFLCIGYFFILNPAKLKRAIEFFERFEGKHGGIMTRLGEKISRMVDSFNEAIGEYTNNRKVIICSIFLTVLSWLFQGFSLCVLLQGLRINLHWTAFLQITAIIAFSEIAGSFSFLPGGLGVKEASIAFFLSFISIPVETGLSISLVWRFITYVQLGIGSALVHSPFFSYSAGGRQEDYHEVH